MVFVIYNGKNIFTVAFGLTDNIVLLPGVNELSDEEVAKMKAHPLMKPRFENDIVKILEPSKLGADGKRSVKEMLEYIPKIFDSKLLKKIIESDGRDQVVQAARGQLDTIKGKKKEDIEEDAHFR